MAGKDFNLSLLENVTAFSTPLKEFSSDYEAIIGLIKEEIDIAQTEDEMEFPKSSKNLPSSAKRKDSESCGSETVFKSPYKKKFSLKMLSPVAQPIGREKKLAETDDDRTIITRENKNRARSLGRAKPGRSSSAARRRRSLNSTSESSNFSLRDEGSRAQTPGKILVNGCSFRRAEGISLESGREASGAEGSSVDSAIADEENSVSSKAESTSLATTDPLDLGTANESFVLSSQTTSASSELREKLNRRRSVAEIASSKSEIIDENAEKSDDENENFSLVLSPIRPKRRKISGSPLNGLSQELENCIRNGDYVEMCDSETESMSFTFETIQLLNEYEDGNQQANNKIFDKILSSPANRSKTDLLNVEVASEIEQPTEDPLRIEDSTEASMQSKLESKATTTKEPKTPLRKSTRTPKGTKKAACVMETQEDPSEEKETEKKKSPASTSKRKETAKPKTTEKKSITMIPGEETSPDVAQTNRERLNVDDVYTDDGETPKKITPSRSSDEFDDSATSDKTKRRSSNRLATRKSTLNVTYWESDDEDLLTEAEKLAKNVAAVQEKDALSQEIFDKLNKLVVRLRHEVPPQHEIETRAGSTALSYLEQKLFLSYAPLNKGKYSPAEDEIIKANWNDFCEDHDWNPEHYKPFILFKHGKQLIMSSLAERRKFVQYLANGLPHRPLCSVYSRFRLIYNKYEAAGLKYTQEEDTQIVAYMTYVPGDSQDQRCAELAKVMNRSRMSIWKRYKTLVGKKCPTYQTKRVLTKVEWDLPLIELFLETLLSVTLSDELDDLKGAFMPRVVWLKMEEKMQISWDIMQRFWEHKLHLQLFVPEPIYMNEIRIKLIEYMHMNKIRDCKEIKWNNVEQYFDGYTKSFLRYVFNLLTMQTAGALQTRNFSDILEWLHSRRITELRFKMWDRNLPRITYKNKRAEFVAEDLELIRVGTDKSNDD